MTGKRLSDDRRQILAKLLQIEKLTNHDIAFVLNVDERTIRRRRYEFATTGSLAKARDVSKNAEKLRDEHLKKLQAWLKGHDDALLEDMQLFLREQCGLEVSIPTISRKLKKASGVYRTHGRRHRMKVRDLREAEGRALDLELPAKEGGVGDQQPAARAPDPQEEAARSARELPVAPKPRPRPEPAVE